MDDLKLYAYNLERKTYAVGFIMARTQAEADAEAGKEFYDVIQENEDYEPAPTPWTLKDDQPEIIDEKGIDYYTQTRQEIEQFLDAYADDLDKIETIKRLIYGTERN